MAEPFHSSDAWIRYPTSPSQCDLFTTPGAQLSDCVSSHSGSLFLPEPIEVRLIDIGKTTAGRRSIDPRLTP